MTDRNMTFRIVVVVASLVAGGGNVDLQAADPPRLPPLQPALLAGTAADFALDPQSGNLAAVEHEAKRIVLYASELKPLAAPLKPIAAASLEQVPLTILYKSLPSGGVFVVGCYDDRRLHVYEAATLKELAKIRIAGSDIHYLTTSALADDPYVYYCCPHRNQNWADLGRADLVQNKDEGQIGSGQQFCAVSARGGYVYRWGSTENTEAVRFTENTIAGENPRLTPRYSTGWAGVLCVPDHFENFVYTGQVFTAGFEKKIAQLDFQPRCVFRDRPLIAGFDGVTRETLIGYRHYSPTSPQIVVASSNTYQRFGTKPLPKSFWPEIKVVWLGAANTGYRRSVLVRPKLFADEAHRRIVVAYQGQAGEIPLSEFDIQDEPVLALEADIRKPLLVGRQETVRFTKIDPLSKVELVEPLESATITDEGLPWTPSESHLGSNLVAFRVSRDGFEKIISLEVTVERDGIALPFDAGNMAVSDDAQSALVWTTPDAQVHRYPGASPVFSRGAVVDLAAKTVVAARELPSVVHLAAIEDRFVFTARQESTSVAVLDRNTLALQRELPVNGKVVWLNAVDGKLLLVGTGDGRTYKYSLPDLKLIGEHRGLFDPFRPPRPGRSAAEGLIAVDGGYWLPTGDVYDATLTKPLLVGSMPGLVNVAPSGLSPVGRSNGPMPTTSIGPAPVAGDSNVAVVRSGRFPDRGISVSLTRATRSLAGSEINGYYLGTMALQLLDPQTGAPPPVRTIPLATTYLSPGAYGYVPSSAGALSLVGDRLHVLTPTRLFSFPVAELSVGKPAAEKPLEFVRRQSATVVDASTSTKLTHSLVGGKPPFTFALTNPQPGVQIDAASGDITVDGSAVVAAALPKLIAAPRPNSSQGGRWKSPQEIEDYIAKQGPVFEQIAGRAPSDVPLALEMNVQATDATPHTADLRYFVVVDVPDNTMNDYITAEFARSRPPGAELDDRIRKLEDRLSSLEGQIDLLIKVLSQPAAK